MKSITLPQQRLLYSLYKKSVLEGMHNLDALYNTGSYSRPSRMEMIENAKSEILKFSSCFEESLQIEIQDQMKKL